MELAHHGAHVIVASRTPSRAIAAVKEIQEATGNARVEFIQLDLASTDSITQFVEEFKAKNLPINLLMNNAGVMACPYELSKDGIEMQFATNHASRLSHIHLTSFRWSIPTHFFFNI
jgi:retinol dehydrogenase-12